MFNSSLYFIDSFTEQNMLTVDYWLITEASIVWAVEEAHRWGGLVWLDWWPNVWVVFHLQSFQSYSFHSKVPLYGISTCALVSLITKVHYPLTISNFKSFSSSWFLELNFSSSIHLFCLSWPSPTWLSVMVPYSSLSRNWAYDLSYREHSKIPDLTNWSKENILPKHNVMFHIERGRDRHQRRC